MKDLIESNLDKMDTQFLVLLTLRLLPEQYAAETLKLILKTETDETNETVRNSKIRILCKSDQAGNHSSRLSYQCNSSKIDTTLNSAVLESGIFRL
jgi:hypothetical protein